MLQQIVRKLTHASLRSSVCCLGLVGGSFVESWLSTGTPLVAAEAKEVAEEKEVPALLKHKMKSLSGEETDLGELSGKVLLIVNTASKCGATPQYKTLQALHDKYKEQGLVVLGFPCNQFGSQEPGTEKEISEFCTTTYKVSFPMFAKVEVNGDKACDLFKQLTSEEVSKEDPGPVKWNFEKFLVDRNGNVIRRFRTQTKPDSEEVIEALEKALAEEAPAEESKPSS